MNNIKRNLNLKQSVLTFIIYHLVALIILPATVTFIFTIRSNKLLNSSENISENIEVVE